MKSSRSSSRFKVRCRPAKDPRFLTPLGKRQPAAERFSALARLARVPLRWPWVLAQRRPPSQRRAAARLGAGPQMQRGFRLHWNQKCIQGKAIPALLMTDIFFTHQRMHLAI